MPATPMFSGKLTAALYSMNNAFHKELKLLLLCRTVPKEGACKNYVGGTVLARNLYLQYCITTVFTVYSTAWCTVDGLVFRLGIMAFCKGVRGYTEHISMGTIIGQGDHPDTQ